jgi:two-component system, NtrC family, response regulator AtoC
MSPADVATWPRACSLWVWNTTAKMATQPITRTPDPAFVYGQGADLQSLNVLAAEIAGTDIPVLLVGESGAGKGVYARLIHRLSSGSESSFLRVNCGALDSGQMLGDVREAFQNEADTAESRRTVFLDGVHELDAACQRALLSLLPDGERNSQAPSQPRIISSTSCNFEKEIEAGRFRLELYFRLNGVILRLPALRERKEDIPDLLECFVLKHASDLRKSAPEIGREARKLLFSYDWPGNIRELENVARKIVAIGDADLALTDLRNARMPHLADEARHAEPEGSGSPGIASLKVAARAASRKTERELILKALEQTHWNRKRAARNLQISYKSLLYKIKQIGAQVPIAEKGEEKA